MSLCSCGHHPTTSWKKHLILTPTGVQREEHLCHDCLTMPPAVRYVITTLNIDPKAAHDELGERIQSITSTRHAHLALYTLMGFHNESKVIR